MREWKNSGFWEDKMREKCKILEKIERERERGEGGSKREIRKIRKKTGKRNKEKNRDREKNLIEKEIKKKRKESREDKKE